MTTADRRGWRTSSYTSNGGTCVEVAPVNEGVLLRDTKDHGAGPVIRLAHDEWSALVDAALAGAAHPAAARCDALTRHDGRDIRTSWRVRLDPGGAELHFTEAEWSAFLAGARAGEFAFAELATEPV